MEVDLTINDKPTAKRFRDICRECGELGMIARCTCGCPICEKCQASPLHADPCSCIAAREKEESEPIV